MGMATIHDKMSHDEEWLVTSAEGTPELSLLTYFLGLHVAQITDLARL
jgi:hypothetical protein